MPKKMAMNFIGKRIFENLKKMLRMYKERVKIILNKLES